MEKIYCNVNSKFISELIKDSKNRVVYAAPGINRLIMGSIFEVKDKLELENISIIIDADSNVLRYGYGDEESVSFMSNLEVMIKTQKGLRIGFICVDSEGYIFSPTPLSLEDEKLDNNYPNAIHLSGIELERILNSIIPKSPLENENIQIGKNKLRKEDVAKIKEDIDNKPIIKPNLQRQLNVINSTFQIVEIDFKGSKLQNRTFKIDAKELGIVNKEIAEKISTSYKIFKSLSLPIEIENLEKELNIVKEKCLNSVDKVGLLLLYENNKDFNDEIDKFRKNIEDVQKNYVKKIEKVLNISMVELVDFIVGNLIKLPLKEKEKLISYDEPNKENLKIYVESKIRRDFPKADQLLNKIELNVKIFNISGQLMKDKKFIDRIEKHFNKSFGEIANVEKALGTKDEKNQVNGLFK